MRIRTLLSALSTVMLVTSLQAQVNYARDLVNPFVGTGGHGHTFPGACVPNGLVQLSPDTRTSPTEWDGCGGYHYSDSIIFGFSHTHLSGTGCADLCDVLFMPYAQKYGASNAIVSSSHFSHSSERASAGYYQVRLDEAKVLAELTSTQRVGVHRYTFDKGGDAWININLSHRDKLIHAGMDLRYPRSPVDRNEIVGERRSSSWAKDQRLFYCIRFSVPWAEQILSVNGQDTVAATLWFGALEKPLVVKVGISAVSIDGARANLDAEVPGWDFDAVRKQAEDAWNAKLSKIDVEGGTREQQRVFYTAIYHSYIVPSVFNDVDGNYRGMDGQVHHSDHKVYTVFSLWDTFRALHPLMTILEPDMTNDFIKTFLLHYQQGGKLPVWELWGNETDCMIGYHSVSVIADAYLKGIRDFDADLALEAMVASAMQNTPGLDAYRTKGFISSEDESDCVSKTLEYAYDDGCIAQLANAMGKDSLAKVFFERSSQWQNMLDPQSKFFRARRNGGFIAPFDPYEVNFNYTEANAWQYSLCVPQNIPGLIAKNDGPTGMRAHLDRLFSANTSTSGREQADITGLIGQYAHGNEPSHHMAYLYDRIGQPEKSRALVKRIMDEFYHDAPDGLIGNEDCGQMSAWYVMSAIGLYQTSPGVEVNYDIGYALFPKATVHLSNGKTWTVQVTDKGSDHPDQGAHTPSNVAHQELMSGGTFLLNEDRTPLGTEGSNGMHTVLSGAYAPGPDLYRSAPIIQAPSRTFSSPLEVIVKGEHGTCMFTDGTGTHPCPMNAPFMIENTSSVQVDWSDHYAPVIAHFTKIDGSRTVTLQSRYSNQYNAGGDNALIDGLRGGLDFRTGEWQGFHDTDLTATIDLGSIKQLQRAGLSVLQDQNAWIWYPSEVTFAWSMNGRQWSSATVKNTVDRKADGGMHQELWSPLIGKKARFVKVIAKNAGPCPDWHLGKGGATWIFADEILTEME